MNRRSYALTLIACLAGAGLVLYAASRTWSLQVVTRPGMSDLRTARTGADLEPWLIGLALVALAGTGALLATSGRVRRGLGGLLALVGAGIVVGALLGRSGLDTGEAGTKGVLWPVVCVLGGAIVAAGGVTAARFGHRWPGMSARYERKMAPAPTARAAAESEPSATPGGERGETSRPVDNRVAWDALDRGDDPTS
jgi:uncharacterized membrane protein (TIGR02234 family)